jgi:XTP/dITP diphosphohydrolase
MKLLIATRNYHKLAEIETLWQQPAVRLVSMKDYPGIPDVVEDGATFLANATKKAVTLAEASGLWALADDSGLEVAALDGAPGVYSARFAGEPADDEANIRKLLQMLGPGMPRRAWFRCVIVLATPEGDTDWVEGRCEGQIAAAPRGDHGFGYDPVFIPDGHVRTFSELGPAVKNAISHRAVALRLACEKWATRLRAGV